MKLKYYLRGLGVGILFCAIIVAVAYGSDKNNMSDAEIMKKAEKLGMVKAEQLTEDISEEITSEVAKDTEEITTEEVVTKEKTTEEKTTEEKTTEEKTTEEKTTEEKTTEEKTTEEKTTEEKTTEEKTTEEDKKDKKEDKKNKNDDKYVKATITVTSGMDSVDVAKLLQEAGIIKDYLDFDNYLNQNGYSTQIRVKSCEFNSKMTYQEIAELLVKEE